ncbi:AI-2E family transporter [Halorientalis pallida]|uniref:AI-2E family transporter n=1 Tax=Halorientalis pallida TaxID=2479928 RepID=A0A498L1C0_9EURY|nr:AI-2E family transporter [Halorientalis pallida]RXK51776.1 AI-2E family transporter [Halorientalis pallida]
METTWTVSRAQAAWAVVGLVVGSLVAFVLVSFVGALAVGVFLYYAVRPAYRRIERRLGRSDLGATLALGLVGVPILAVLGYAALVAVRAVDRFVARTDLSQYQSLLAPYLDVAALTEPGTLFDLLGGNVGRVAGYFGLAVTWSVRLFVAITVAYYLLCDGDRIGDWFRATFGGSPGAVAFAEQVDTDLRSVYTGNLLVIGATAAIAVGVYSLLGLVAPPALAIRFPLLLGLLTGIFTLVPAVGMKVIWVPYALSLVVRSLRGDAGLWFPVLFVVVTFVVVDFLPDVFVRSYLSSGDLHMGLLVLTYVLASIAFGWSGIFLGPILLVVAIHFAREVLPALVGGGSPSVEEN